MRIRSLLMALIAITLASAAWADISPPPSLAPFTPESRGGRPVAAAGLRFLYALNASYFEVYKRNADGSPGAKVVARRPLASLFLPLIERLNRTVYPAATGINPCPAELSKAPYAPPRQGLTPFANVACIEGAYDSDVLYDPQTKRIWILAHLRPSIWECPKDSRGFFTPADPEGVCHVVPPEALKQTLHRYIAVAVSRPGASPDVEDPANGFHAFVLADDYGDWTQLMVHNGLVLVNSRDLRTDNRLYVFAADDLMNDRFGPDKALLPPPLAKFDNHDFSGAAVDWVGNRSLNVKPTTAMMFVRQSSDDNVTYLLSGTDDAKMIVYGLGSRKGEGGRRTAPELIPPAVVSLPERMPPLQKASAAYADGYLYWGWAVLDPHNANRSFIRTFRWEAHRAGHAFANTHPMFVTNAPGSNYLEADIGAADSSTSYVLPTLAAAPNGDVLTMFHSYPTAQWPDGPFQASVQYATLRKGRTAYDAPYLLQAAVGKAKAPPHRGGVLDIVSVAADPLVPGQLLLGSAYPDKDGGYAHVVAGAKP